MKQKEMKIKLKDLLSLYNQNKISLYFNSYDNYKIFRKDVWDVKTKSLYIHSILSNFKLNPLILMHNNPFQENNFGVIKGRQRIVAICDYINNKYALYENTPMINKHEIKGLLFVQLPKTLQNKILSFKIPVITQIGSIQENLDSFLRYNSGVSIKPIEMFNAKLGKFGTLIDDISKHNFFALMNLNESQRNEVALYFLMLECNPGIGLAKKQKEFFVNALSSKDNLEKKVVNSLKLKLDYMFTAFYNKTYLDIVKEGNGYLKKAHVIILYQFIDRAMLMKITEEEFFKWCHKFFYTDKNFNNIYWIESSRGSTTSKSSMDIRYNELHYDFNKYFNRRKTILFTN